MHQVPIEALKEVLDKTFVDGTKQAIPIFGAGLNIQAFYGKKDALGWEDLLLKVTSEADIPLSKNPSMTTRWETMVQEYAHRHDLQANDAEKKLRAKVSEVLDFYTPEKTHQQVIHQQFRDIITLNFGTMLSQSAHTSRPELAPSSRTHQQSQEKTQLHTSTPDLERELLDRVEKRHRRYFLCESTPGTHTRIWHPHGTLDNQESIVLGLRDYGVYIEALRNTFACFKGDETAFYKEQNKENTHNAKALNHWSATRRGFEAGERPSYITQPSSWLELLMLSDVIFVGCGLGQDEFPLWWALHQRARNFARYQPSERPKTLYLTTSEQLVSGQLAHLQDSPAGVKIVEFQNHTELWETLLQTS